jgi:hypothetical protein
MKIHSLCSIHLFWKSSRLWDDENYCRTGQVTDDNITRRMRFACCISKTTDTHSEYAILITFARRQWLRERATVLRYTYISCRSSEPFLCSAVTKFRVDKRLHSSHMPCKCAVHMVKLWHLCMWLFVPNCSCHGNCFHCVVRNATCSIKC